MSDESYIYIYIYDSYSALSNTVKTENCIYVRTFSTNCWYFAHLSWRSWRHLENKIFPWTWQSGFAAIGVCLLASTKTTPFHLGYFYPIKYFFYFFWLINIYQKVSKNLFLWNQLQEHEWKNKQPVTQEFR